MGICTFQSYCGAQIFDAVGLSSAFLDKYFTGTASPVEGIGLDEIAEETVRRHRLAFGDAPNYRDALDVGGELAFRVNGERHVWTSDTVSLLQHAVRGNNYRKFKEYTRHAGEQEDGLISLRGLLDFKFRPTSRSRSTRSSPRRDRQALRHRRHVVRLDLAGRRTPRSPSR